MRKGVWCTLLLYIVIKYNLLLREGLEERQCISLSNKLHFSNECQRESRVLINEYFIEHVLYNYIVTTIQKKLTTVWYGAMPQGLTT